MLRSHSHSHTPKANWVHQLPTCRRLHFLSVFLFFSKLELKSIKLIIKSFAMRLRFAFAHTFTAFCFCLICFCSHLLYVRACVDMYAWVCPPACVCVCLTVCMYVCISRCVRFRLNFFYSLLLVYASLQFCCLLCRFRCVFSCYSFFIFLYIFILNSSNWHFLFNFTRNFSGLKSLSKHTIHTHTYTRLHTLTQIE